MNELQLNLITFGTCWLQELPVNHMKSIKINVEIQILYLECQLQLHGGIILSEY